MNPVATIENLLRLGLKVKDAFADSNKDWPAFLKSAEFTAIEQTVNKLLAQLDADHLQQAIKAIQQKKKDVLGGHDVAALAPDRLLQYFHLLNTEKVLVLQQLKAAGSKADFLTVLERDVLPTLVSAAKFIIPLLL